MSSDDENVPAVYDDDDSNEDYRNSIMSGRNSYTVGSTAEEPTFSHPKTEEKPHQQEQPDHLETLTQATEEKTAHEIHDPAQSATTGFHKKEEASAVQSYDQSTYEVLLASQAPPEPTEEEDPTLKSIRPEDLIEESVHQNVPASEQIFNATAEEIQYGEVSAHQEEHKRQLQQVEIQPSTKHEQVEEPATQEAQPNARQQQAPQELQPQPEVVESEPAEHRTDAAEPELQDRFVQRHITQEQPQGNVEGRAEELVAEQDVEPSRFVTTEQKVEQAVESQLPQVEVPAASSWGPDEVAQFVRVEEVEAPSTNQHRQPESIYPEPAGREELPAQQQPSSQKEVHEDVAHQQPQQTNQQAAHPNHSEEFSRHHQEPHHHFEAHHNLGPQISHQPQQQPNIQQQQAPIQQQQATIHQQQVIAQQEQVPIEHQQVPVQRQQVITQQEQAIVQHVQASHQAQEKPASHHEEELTRHNQQNQSHPEPISERLHQQSSAQPQQEAVLHKDEPILQRHQEALRQEEVREEAVSAVPEARQQNVSEFPRKKKDKNIVNIQNATNLQQTKQIVQAHQQRVQEQVNKQTDELVQKQKESEIPSQAQHQGHHQKVQIEASPIVVTVQTATHPLSTTHQLHAQEKPDALVEEQKEHAPIVEKKHSERAADVKVASVPIAKGNSPIEREPEQESKGELQVIRVEPVQIENQRNLARQAGMNEIKRSIPAPTRQNAPLKEKNATGNSETCKCEIM